MRILLLSQYFYPEIGATQTRMFEFAKNLARFGHQVTVIGEFPNHPQGIMPEAYRGKWIETEHLAGFDVLRVWVYASPRKNFKTRILFYISFMFMAILGSLKLPSRFDVVFATSPPLFVPVAGYVIGLIKRSRFVLDVRDLWPAAAVALGEISHSGVVKLAEKLEKFLCGRADCIIAVTQGFCEHIRSLGVARDKIHWIPNGTMVEIFDPRRVEEGIRETLGFKGKTVVTFAGMHGIAQGLDAVMETARLLREKTEIVFLFIGEGPVKDGLMKLAHTYGLDNVVFHPQVPLDKIAFFLNMSDMLLVPLKNDAVFRTFIPSKMFDFMACAKPILLSVPGEAKAIMDKARAGVFVEPENPKALADAIEKLGGDENLMRTLGENGRAFVVEHFSRERQGAQLERLLASM